MAFLARISPCASRSKGNADLSSAAPRARDTTFRSQQVGGYVRWGLIERAATPRKWQGALINRTRHRTTICKRHQSSR